ncbi:MAG TPA: ZIP family metal transporter [Candidatus Limnocylindrales bacterium]|nr:ZIP family metal transporter [Candidatus Limnocylindrales bacterium]
MPLAAVLPFFSTLLGGIAALRLRHRLHAIMALAAGLVVATAVADLLPEAFELAGPDGSFAVGVAVVVGFIAFSLVEAFLHQTSFEHEREGDHEHEHGPDTHEETEARADAQARAESGHGTDIRPAAARRGLLGLLPPVSLIIHSTLDGLAIGLAFQAGGELGLIVLLAVLAHDFADGMNVITLALHAARGQRLAVGLLILDALAPPFGAALSTVVSISDGSLGILLATFAGVFLAIGAGHLLPESQHHDPRHGPAMVLLAALGATIVLIVRALGAG